MTTAGQLRHKVTIQKLGDGESEWGEPIKDQWVDVCSPWADIRQPSGLSAIKADAQVSIVRTSIRIRFRNDVKPGMRVVHGERIYNVKAGPLAVDGKRVFIDLVCEEVM
ncbi:phage head closure protein [Diaphorobacter sp. HDW4B]|uniref:phage head closure protein n=1 Tax=Diaphorobacter sp. HDW4B TaxID=2714925 RepID=UPI001408FA05|nr:phage head closure protein [Diaphorobacter sp. HDW4B]QIL69567.1 phage head closure protein [Diaphorobacter sp. HDW4B]